MNYKWDMRFLDLCKTVSYWSKDPSTKVGAVIVRPDKTVAALGYNGFPRKMPDHVSYLYDKPEKYSRIIHGEINALISAKEPVHGYSLYTFPFMPCDRCFVQMAQAGIVRFIAPMATSEQLLRWGDAFAKTRAYAAEMGLELGEVNMDHPTENQPVTVTL